MAKKIWVTVPEGQTEIKTGGKVYEVLNNKPKKPAAKPKAASTKTPAANTKAKVTKKPAANTKAKVTKKADPPAKTSSASKETTKKTTTKSTKAAPASKAKSKTESKVNGTSTGKKEPAQVKSQSKPAVSRKRKAADDVEEAPAKKTKVTPKGPVINEAPARRLNVYVFGEGSSGELGLGAAKNAIDVKRPRLNANLAADSVGVVQIAAGGMHVVALTHDNHILTWGVNDQGALGRDTEWQGGLKDMDAADDSDSDSGDESDLNPRESTPTAVPADSFPEGTIFTQVAAGDSATFALTDDGKVWGWGTFRSNEGIFGFTTDILVQRTPILLPTLQKIKKIACGANHVLALDNQGRVFAWGSGQQNQLGRRVVERTKAQGLIPREFGLPKKGILDIGCGAYHSFAIDQSDRVWAWGLNSYGETGIFESGAGEDEAVVITPKVVEHLSGLHVSTIHGGSHHSIAVTVDGDCFTWGRVDGCQTGIDPKTLPEDKVVRDDRGAVRILKVPTKVSAISDPVATATASSDHCLAVTRKGQAFAWGFSANYQTGLGTSDDVPIATLIENTAVKTTHLTGAFAGGQYSILVAPAQDTSKLTNGVH